MASFARMITGFFGSVAVFLGIVMFFIALTGSALVNNVDKLDEVAVTSVADFVKENKEEVREYIMGQAGDIEIPTKEELVLMCANYDQLPEDAKAVLSEDVCDGIASKTEDEITDEVVDSYVGGNFEELILRGLPDVKQAILSQKSMFAMIVPLIISSIFVYLIGVGLTFVGANFKPWRGTYRVVFKTAINVGAFTVLYAYLMYLKPEKLIDYMHKIISLNPDYEALSNVPVIFVKMLATVLLDWFRLSIGHMLKLSIYILIPFAL